MSQLLFIFTYNNTSQLQLQYTILCQLNMIKKNQLMLQLNYYEISEIVQSIPYKKCSFSILTKFFIQRGFDLFTFDCRVFIVIYFYT